MSATTERFTAPDHLLQRLRDAMMPLAENPSVPIEVFAEVCDAHLAIAQDLFMRVEIAEARAAAAEAMLASYRREVEQ